MGRSTEDGEMKQCNTCGLTKVHSEFSKKKLASGNYGLTHECKQCKSIKASARYANETHGDRARRIAKAKEWKANNRDVVNGLKRKYRLEKKVIKLSAVPHDHHVKAYQSHVFRQSIIKHDQHVKEWRSDEARISRWDYKHNINHLLYAKLKRGVYRCLGNNATGSNWFKTLGYTVDDLRAHLEKHFTYNMSWDNRHEWHIDHVVPICAFNIKTVDSSEFKACFGLHNLRPIWPDDNRDKYWYVDRVIKQKNKHNKDVINQ